MRKEKRKKIPTKLEEVEYEKRRRQSKKKAGVNGKYVDWMTAPLGR